MDVLGAEEEKKKQKGREGGGGIVQRIEGEEVEGKRRWRGRLKNRREEEEVIRGGIRKEMGRGRGGCVRG